MATFLSHAAKTWQVGLALSFAARAFHARPNRPDRISARKVMIAWPPSSIQAITQALISSADRFCGVRPQSRDRTLTVRWELSCVTGDRPFKVITSTIFRRAGDIVTFMFMSHVRNGPENRSTREIEHQPKVMETHYLRIKPENEAARRAKEGKPGKHHNWPRERPSFNITMIAS